MKVEFTNGIVSISFNVSSKLPMGDLEAVRLAKYRLEADYNIDVSKFVSNVIR